MSTPRPWYVMNLADAPTLRHPFTGTWTRLDSADAPFQEVGINLRTLEPGQPSTIYHAENAEESFLILAGECLAIVGGQERPLRTWDFVHVPPGVPHTFVGAGEGTCAILAVGARHPDLAAHYPVSELAAAHGASVAEPTDSPEVAYADWRAPGFEAEPLTWPIA